MRNQMKSVGAKGLVLVLAAAWMLGGCGGSQAKTETAAPETEAAVSETEAGTLEEESEIPVTEESETETEAQEDETLKETETAAAEEEPESEASVSEEALEEAEETEASSAEEAVTPLSIYQAIEAQVGLPAMFEGDDAFIYNYYGIDPSVLESYVFASAEDATLADSVIIMKVLDPASTDGIVAGLQTVLDQKAVEMENYLPEQYQIVAASSVKTEGDYVYLVISENAGGIEAVIREALN
ncbi:MAG: DUF4358 domain-containing protein [Clostridiales bacterium]|nr:DUF4358 domain-containing protein [Clostridiales bacterium]